MLSGLVGVGILWSDETAQLAGQRVFVSISPVFREVSSDRGLGTENHDPFAICNFVTLGFDKNRHTCMYA